MLQESRSPLRPATEASPAAAGWSHGPSAPAAQHLSATAVELHCLSRSLSLARWLMLLSATRSRRKKKSTPAFQFPGSASHWQNLTKKQLARKSVRFSLRAPSHLVIRRRFQKAGNNAESQMTGSQPGGFKGNVSNWLVNFFGGRRGRHIYLEYFWSVKYIVVNAFEIKIRTACGKEVW